METKSQKWIVGVSGASGTRYALRLIEVLASQVAEVHLVFSEAALRVLNEEDGIKVSSSSLSTQKLFGTSLDNCYFYNVRDIGAAIASGSKLFTGMVVVPCSMASLAAISSGMSQNLLHRAADVCIKENRRLVMVPRETPLSVIHLEHMHKLAQMGVRMVPAMPGFYHQPASIEQLVDMLVMKILDQMDIHVDLVKRWGEEIAADRAAPAATLSFVSEWSGSKKNKNLA